ncbi:hypothetical protein D915_007805 [Fasciola hepatica]|uniref:DRBM domain-containing protein n=1 Tax=Fasciola hepatica TaxID=6192 RepID=A0A4E0RYC5_FASHE|nr:hypothetical protein D915_007805 [Fasciola hepatica]
MVNLIEESRDGFGRAKGIGVSATEHDRLHTFIRTFFSSIGFSSVRFEPDIVKCLADLVNGVPHPLGPLAELKQIAKIFQFPTNFIRLSSHRWSKENRQIFGDKDQVVLHRIALEFAGRQYVGEGVARSTCEQHAASAALKAFRRALLSIIENTEEKQYTEPHKFVFRPDSAIWKLRVIAKLHGERPVFVIGPSLSPIPNDAHPDRDNKRTTCACSFKLWGTVHGDGPTLREARERAAQLMLARLSHGALPIMDNNNAAAPSDRAILEQPSSENKSFKKINRNQTKQQFACDRADLSYGQEVNPIARLYFVCVARELPAPIFDLTTASKSTGLLSGSNKAAPEFSYQVRLSTGLVKGPTACSKRLARRLAAEAALAHLGLHPPDPPKLHSALRSPLSQIPDCEVVTDTAQADLTSSESVKSADSPPCTEEQGSLNERHVTFSCSRDVLILEENDSVPRRRTHRSIRRNHATEIHSDTKVSPPKSAFVCDRGRGRCTASPNPSVATTQGFINIGHWADSQEAQTVYRSVNLRRANSYSHVNHFEWDTPIEPSRSSSLHQLITDPRATVTNHGCASELPSNPGLHLLCQLAVFCLLEHASGSKNAESPTTAKRPSSQLISMCQRLQIPCQFTDHQLKTGLLEKGTTSDALAQSTMYSTVLTIGISLRTSVDQETCNLNPNKVIVRGSGRTKEAAHDDAVILAFRQLAQLHVPFQTATASTSDAHL